MACGLLVSDPSLEPGRHSCASLIKLASCTVPTSDGRVSKRGPQREPYMLAYECHIYNLQVKSLSSTPWMSRSEWTPQTQIQESDGHHGIQVGWKLFAEILKDLSLSSLGSRAGFVHRLASCAFLATSEGLTTLSIVHLHQQLYGSDGGKLIWLR